MEKFRSTADPSTGVHPFLPTSCDISIARQIVQFFLFLPLRLPALFLGVVLTCVLAGIATVIKSISPSLARPLFRLAHVAGIRSILFGLGVWVVRSPTIDERRTRDARVRCPPRHGDIIFANSASYLDPLYLAVVYSPVFVFISEENKYCSKNLMSAITAVADGNKQPRAESAMSLDSIAFDAVRSRSGPIAIFAEGTTTNGAGVLKFAEPEEQIAPNNMYALGLSYSHTRCEAYTVGGIVWHILRLMSLSSTQVRAKVQQVVDLRDMQRVVANLAGVPALRLTRSSRRTFESHWASVKKGYR